MNIVNFFGFIASITSIIGLIPQIYHTYKLKSAHDISMLMLCNYFICSMAWIIYGGYTNSQFVIFSNILGAISSIISIAQKRYYDAQYII